MSLGLSLAATLIASAGTVGLVLGIISLIGGIITLVIGYKKLFNYEREIRKLNAYKDKLIKIKNKANNKNVSNKIYDIIEQIDLATNTR